MKKPNDIAKMLPDIPLAFPVNGKRSYVFQDGKCRIKDGGLEAPAASKSKDIKRIIEADKAAGVFEKMEAWAATFGAGTNGTEETEDSAAEV